METEEIVLGGGCFWCLEAIFHRLKGVISVLPGYAGGMDNGNDPTYEKVCSGKTGHAEVIKVVFDKNILSLENVLRIFFAMHDPTTPNRQGKDVGTQYRSIILYSNQGQRDKAEEIIREIAKSNVYGESMIVTELKMLEKFHEAEQYHHEYYEKNPAKAYCQLLITPKLVKFRNQFKPIFKEA